LFENTHDNQDRAKHGGIYAVARLKPGISMRDAQADLDLISARLARLIRLLITRNREQFIHFLRSPYTVYAHGSYCFLAPWGWCC
jgi:hypothetical protein